MKERPKKIGEAGKINSKIKTRSECIQMKDVDEDGDRASDKELMKIERSGRGAK